jgi:hypothetical protein
MVWRSGIIPQRPVGYLTDCVKTSLRIKKLSHFAEAGHIPYLMNFLLGSSSINAFFYLAAC